VIIINKKLCLNIQFSNLLLKMNDEDMEEVYKLLYKINKRQTQENKEKMGEYNNEI